MTTANISPTVPGGPYLVDEFDVGNQMAGTPSNPSAAVLGNGDIVTVWEVSGSPDGATPAKVYAQVHDANGGPVGRTIEIASSAGVAHLKPVVTVLEDSSYVVAYATSETDMTTMVDVERVAYKVVDGSAVGDEKLVDRTGSPQTGHAITTLENGDFVIGWTEDGSIMTQTFAGSYAGLPAGEPYAPANDLRIANPATGISLTALKSADGFAVAFVDVYTSNIFLATSENQGMIPGSMNGFGNLSSPNSVSLTQVSGDGAVRPPTAGLPEVDVATLTDGRVVVTWDSWIDNGPSGSGSGISYSILDAATGSSDPWGVRAASEETIGNQAGVTVTALSGGGFVLAWENGGTGDAAEIMGRSFDANGHGMHHAFPINQDFLGAQTSPTLVAFDDNTFGTVWVDTPVGGYGVRIEGRVSTIPPVGMPDLAPESDSGANHEDNVTSNAWLRFTGSVGPENDAADVSVFIDLNHNGQLDNGDAIGTSSAFYGQYTVDMDTPRNVEGTFNVFAFASDFAGHAGPLSTPLQVTIDTLAPTNLVNDVWFGDRYSPSKMVTNSLQPVLHGELAQPLQVGETIQVNVYGNWQDLPVLPGQTQWTAPIDLSQSPYQQHEFQLRVVDSAGNAGLPFFAPFQIDIHRPSAQLLSNIFVEMPANDQFVIDIYYSDMQTGFAPATFNSSNITVSFGNTTLDVISAVINDSNSGSSNGNIDGVIVSYTVRAPGGTWDPADAGAYQVSFNAQTIRDTAGNALDAPGFYLHVSPRQVVTPSTPDLVDQFDSGDLPFDNVTAATTIAVTGVINEPDGAQVTAFIDIDKNGQFDALVDRAGSGTAHYGAWTVEGLNTADLEGSYNIYAFNAAGSAAQTDMPLTVTFDHIAPGRAVGMRMSEDTGASASDLVTRYEYQHLTFSFDGTMAPTDYAEIRINGADGWMPVYNYGLNELSAPVYLNQSGYVEVRARDSAGNVGEIVRHDYVVDNTGGSAQTKAEDVSSPGATEYSFTVVYADSGAGIDLSTIGLNNVQVQGPAGNLLPVLRFEVMNDTTISPFSALLPTGPVTGPQEVTVKYTVEAPGGSWDQGDDGTYVANVVMGQVLDRAGNPIMFAMGDMFDVMLKPANASPTGIVTITGTASAGQTLTASNTLDDLDGIAPNGIAYQWQAGGVDIAGATGSTFTLGQEQVGKFITVVASYTDLKNNSESQVSAATALVTHVNTAPTGGVTITGEPKQGGILTASNTLADADGIGANGISYQWQAGGVDIGNATGATLLLGQEHVGKAITVVAKYIDQQGTAEAPVSLATAAVANVNDMPTGSVTITGTPAQGQFLTATNTLADLDGIAIGGITYQWQADGVAIAGATGSAFQLGQEQVGKAITVVASYTDLQGHAEAPVSAATAAVANVNDGPTGIVTITGTTSEGQTLTASNTLGDLDGIAPNGIAYQWQAGGVDIAGATGSAFTLGQEQVGKVITVVASYTDLQGTVESRASGATSAVGNRNDLPTGGVTITGGAAQGQTLTAANTLADADGIGANAITYQWQAGGVDIAGATGSTFVLGQAEVGKAITVVARYTDQNGTAESVASAATAAVANINDAPTGTVTINGTSAQGHTLTAVNTLNDADGIAPGSITYQWKADGVDIAGATGSALVLTSGQNGKAITVVAAYTDARGTVESVASLATASVVDVNDKPVVTATAATAAQYVAGNAGGVSLFSNVALSTVEDGQAISEVVLRVSGLKDAGSETLLIGGKSLALVDGTSVALDIGGTAKVVLVDGALTVSIRNAEGWSAASAEAMIEGIQYSNTATAPTFAGQRSVELASVKDNGGTALGGSDTAFVAITSKATVVAAAIVTPPDTSATVDGVTVQTGQITNPDGSVSQTLTVPVIVPNRTEQVGNNGVADIPLVTGTNGQALLSAQVSTGIGLTITGSNEAKSAGNSLADLIREIKAHTTAGSADQNQLTGGGSGFLSDLPATTNLLVQTIVTTAAPGATSPGQALVINGTPSSANTPMTALVIDTRALPGGSTIQLNNVEFAAVIGSVRVTGGAGSQNVWGDGESQYIMLGADDDVLHGGAGNDTVGSAGGNDKVYGDEGDDLVFGGIGNDLLDGGTGRDTAEFTGNGRASYSLRVKDGNIVITDLHGDDGIDTLANVEQLRFTSEQADTSLHGTVARLLEAATGKAPDLLSADRWLDVAQKGTDLAAVANSLIADAGLDKLDNAAFVSAMYRNVLHRDADATGAAYWRDALAAGTVDRAGMVLSMAESAEKLALPQSLDMDFSMSDVATLVRMYSTLFGRAGDEGGLNFWIGMYESGASLSGVADAFIASSEADARYGAMTDEQFIESLYQVAFDRVGQANEVGYWVDGLEAGAIDRGEVLLSFANSAEQIELIGTIGTSFATL